MLYIEDFFFSNIIMKLNGLSVTFLNFLDDLYFLF